MHHISVRKWSPRDQARSGAGQVYSSSCPLELLDARRHEKGGGSRRGRCRLRDGFARSYRHRRDARRRSLYRCVREVRDPSDIRGGADGGGRADTLARRAACPQPQGLLGDLEARHEAQARRGFRFRGGSGGSVGEHLRARIAQAAAHAPPAPAESARRPSGRSGYGAGPREVEDRRRGEAARDRDGRRRRGLVSRGEGAPHPPRPHSGAHAHYHRNAAARGGGAARLVLPRAGRRDEGLRGKRGACRRGGAHCRRLPGRPRPRPPQAPRVSPASRGGRFGDAAAHRPSRSARKDGRRVPVRREARGDGEDRPRALRDRGQGARRVLPDMLGHRTVRPLTRDPHPRARVRGQLARLVRTRHHPFQSAATQHVLRAVPQPRARASSRLRPRLRHRRPGDHTEVHLPQVRQGPRRDDRHLQHPAGALGAARDGEGARDSGGGDTAVHKDDPLLRLDRQARSPRRGVRRALPDCPSTASLSVPSSRSRAGSAGSRGTWRPIPAGSSSRPGLSPT